MGGGDRKLTEGTDYKRVFTRARSNGEGARVGQTRTVNTLRARENMRCREQSFFVGSFRVPEKSANLKVMTKLPHGLTERALIAARKINFTPAVKDGQAVSMYIQLEYNFNLY